MLEQAVRFKAVRLAAVRLEATLEVVLEATLEATLEAALEAAAAYQQRWAAARPCSPSPSLRARRAGAWRRALRGRELERVRASAHERMRV